MMATIQAAQTKIKITPTQTGGKTLLVVEAGKIYEDMDHPVSKRHHERKDHGRHNHHRSSIRLRCDSDGSMKSAFCH